MRNIEPKYLAAIVNEYGDHFTVQEENLEIIQGEPRGLLVATKSGQDVTHLCSIPWIEECRATIDDVVWLAGDTLDPSDHWIDDGGTFRSRRRGKA